ncbi:GPCR kinase [Trema orientale]|uniref:GPCR kinase n=1 Tax=Trema orientale TaxID=63057 RepID=A0A2P5F2B3_TREOI|nr:GPCR kinase [Trema orientale]
MEFTKGPTIGRGATSTVYLASDDHSGELFAVKSSDLSCSVFLRKEQSFLSRLSSSRIVKYLGFSVNGRNDSPTYNLCMEYVSGGTLFDVIQRRGGKLDESLIKLYTYQILQGLEYLHGNGLAHCDIKSRNILVGEEGVKIADLGCAKLVERVDWIEDFDDSASLKFSGTPAFMAPEVARGEEQGFGADIWALGCTVIEMATGGGPWQEMNDPASALYRIGYSDHVPEFPSGFSAEGKDFLSKCLKRDSKERWTAKELLGHPFLHQALEESQLEQLVVPEEAKTTSPSSVLDRGLWDEPEFEGCFSNSAEERIKSLVGGTVSCHPNGPNWSWDEDWFTVRSNDFEEDPVEDSSSTTTTYLNSINHEEELVDSSVFDEELSFDHYSVELGLIP